MKKRVISRMLSLALATSLTVSSVPMNFYSISTVKAAAMQNVAVEEDGIMEEVWNQDEATVKGEGAVCEVQDGWLHLKADPTNGNNPGQSPAMFVSPKTFNFDEDGFFSFTMKSADPETDRFGVYLGYNTENNGMFVGYDTSGWFWQKYQGGDGDWYQGKRTAAPTKDTETEVRIDWTADKKMSLTVGETEVFTNEDFSAIADALGDKIAFKCGAFNGQVTDVFVKDIHYTGQETGTPEEPGETETFETVALETDEMTVYAAKDFPSVEKYVMKGDLAGKTFYGQTKKINTIRVNRLIDAAIGKYDVTDEGVDIKVEPSDVTTTVTDNKITYVMKLKNEDKHVDAEITAELVAEKNTLSFNITEIKNNLAGDGDVEAYPIQTVAIPNHSLISVRSSQKGANLKGAAMSSNTTVSGDEYKEIKADTKLGDRDYMYAFVSNDELSAGLWSNSEHEGRDAKVLVYGGSLNTRVMSTAEKVDKEVSMGLASTPWFYHRVVESAPKLGEDGKTYTKKYVVEETEMPKAKVVITGDKNDDNQVDWQDGAVAFRDIMHNPFKSEEVPELVAYRIAMNFGGHAQNPFLTTLDNVKRVAMHTDGLGQSVLLKGYGSEGHDSGHPDYADIGTRIGGAEDMNFLMTKGAEYGAKFGIHVNAGEMYPEAKAFSDMLVRRNADGGLRYGWNWIDQGVGIDSVYDLGEGLREKRFDELEEKVGQNLDFVYVDIWGNRTGGSDDSWQTRKLSKEINDNGWRMATEWGPANEYDATFQHWATDLTYGGYTQKGENSEVIRFLRNHQKDSWVADYPKYGGAAIAPLLGGYNMKDFEGWQGRNDYDTYITNLYTHDVTTKFIQHYKVVKWEDGEPFTANNGSVDYTWTPDMKITLKDGDDTLVLERGSADPNSAAYRERTMTLNGKVIAMGAPSSGDRTDAQIQKGERKGTETYLLPWIWDSATGERVAAEDEKLYHWNTQGGTTTWDLPESWANVAEVKVYKLTDLGKTEEKTVKVKNGKILLTAESEIPYVVCKGAEKNLQITWSEGMHIVDAGFNSGEANIAKNWTKAGAGTAKIAKSQYSNPMLKLDGEISMTQEITDLKAGQQYAVLVGVDNRSDAKAAVTVNVDGKAVASNYTTKSIAKNYVKAYTHSNSSATADGTSYFQNMYVFFTAPASGKVTLTLSREAGEGSAYFDDIRITENESKNITTDKDGNVVKFEQDFETSVQGLYPFVVGGVEGVEDNRTHLSEKHAPYTQAGWDVKKMDDVLAGNWSLKVNGLDGGSNIVYQTIPQNFRFEPGVAYKVSFDYQVGSDDIYGVMVGNGEYQKGSGKLTKLKKSLGKTVHYSDMIIGAEGGQTWFGIYSTDAAPDFQGATGSAQAFGGYMDIVLDNLVIEKTSIDKGMLEKFVKDVKDSYDETVYTADTWEVLSDALEAADKVLAKENATESEVTVAYRTIEEAIAGLVVYNPAADAKDDIPVEGVTVTAGSEDKNGKFGANGSKDFVIDGNEETAWFTDFDEFGAELENAWIDLQYPAPYRVSGLRYLPAQNEPNYGGGITPVVGYEVWVKTADSEEYQKATEGTWAQNLEWKMASFEPIDNVTNVKLVVTAAGTTNWWGQAAEIRATKAAVNTDVNTDALNKAIAAAKELKQADYTEASWAAFSKAMNDAAAVSANENATQAEVDAAADALNKAMDALEKKAEPEKPVEPEKPATAPFKDIADSVHKDAIIWAYNAGIAKGVSKTEFVPQANSTRADTLMFLWRANGEKKATHTKNPFKDVKAGDYYYDAVLWAVENGITTGVDATHFVPSAPVTRAETVTFLHRLNKKPAATKPAGFKDLDKNQYYYNAVLWAAENGVVKGYSDTKFGPDDQCLRGQIVQILYNAK